MGIYKKESLEQLRDRIDLPDLISSYVPMKKQGGIHKGLCPFHDEKTPSFTVQKSHYHCFGCGAHGDAIAFLMQHLKVGFSLAVEMLAERFGISLEKGEKEEEREGIDKGAIKAALDFARRFYQVILRQTEEGQKALSYLYKRGIDNSFIDAFDIGYAPSPRQALYKVAVGAGLEPKVLAAAGLVSNGKELDFFSERIMFPIKDLFGATIGFSGRKIAEETFGGKYINSPETKVFKKSKVLFGIKESRQRMAKEKKALIVEGQIDALRLIYEGLDFTVAAQGTAFGQEHVKMLADLGVTKVFLAMDGDEAGEQASLKVGHLFQQVGIGVSVVSLPKGSDPDSFVRKEGISAFSRLLSSEAKEYIRVVMDHCSQGKNLQNPSEKSEVARKVAQEVRSWNDPILVYETLRKVAQLLSIPEELLGISRGMPVPMMKASRQSIEINPHLAIEMDLIRWMLLVKESSLLEIIDRNVTPLLFFHEGCKRIFSHLFERRLQKEELDLISLASVFEKEEEEQIVSELMGKKINLAKAKEGIISTIKQLLNRKWMQEREHIRMKIQSGICSEEEVLRLAKIFDEMKKQEPEVIVS